MWELYDHEIDGAFLVYRLHGKEKAVKSIFALRCMMIAISAKMIHDLEY